MTSILPPQPGHPDQVSHSGLFLGRLFRSLLILSLAAAITTAAYTGWFIYQAVVTPYQAYLEKTKLINIPTGISAAEVCRRLAASGVIADAKVFLYYLRLSRFQGKIKAGLYDFETPLTMPEVARKLTRGDVALIRVTIPEGLIASRVFRILASKGLGDYVKYMAIWARDSQVAEFSPHAGSLEGYLFPDTYAVPPGVDETAVVEIMLHRFRQVAWAELRDAHPPVHLTTHQVLTLASMVEKETGTAEERALIASVFYNRLEGRMKLQCDPTVIYAEWLEKKFWDGQINLSDLKRESPYNTYRYPGLPPGPICNPGLAAIHAAAHPAKTEYLYFVSTNNGRHLFSVTLAQHNQAVQQYQRQHR